MTTYSALQTLIEADLRFRDWTFQFDVEKGRPRLRATFEAPCAITGESATQNGRWWPLSLHMTRSEVVATALKAVLTAVEHEAREDFLYRGEAVFGPHYDVDELHRLCVDHATDVRV